MVAKYGSKRWSLIASRIAGRIGKQCRERWLNHLDPDVKKCGSPAPVTPHMRVGKPDEGFNHAQIRVGRGGGPHADRGPVSNRKPLVPDRQAASRPVRRRLWARFHLMASRCPRRGRGRLRDPWPLARPSSENAVKNRWNSIMNRKWAHDAEQAGPFAAAAGLSPAGAASAEGGRGEPALVPTPPSAHRRRRAVRDASSRARAPGTAGAASPGEDSTSNAEAAGSDDGRDMVAAESQVFFRGLPGRRNRRLRHQQEAQAPSMGTGELFPSTAAQDRGGGAVPRRAQRFSYRAPDSSVKQAVASTYQSLARTSAVPPLPTPEGAGNTGFLANHQGAWRQHDDRGDEGPAAGLHWPAFGGASDKLSPAEAQGAVGAPHSHRAGAGTRAPPASEGAEGLHVAQQFLVSEMARQRLFDRVSLQCVALPAMPPFGARSFPPSLPCGRAGAGRVASRSAKQMRCRGTAKKRMTRALSRLVHPS